MPVVPKLYLHLIVYIYIHCIVGIPKSNIGNNVQNAVNYIFLFEEMYFNNLQILIMWDIKKQIIFYKDIHCMGRPKRVASIYLLSKRKCLRYIPELGALITILANGVQCCHQSLHS